MAEKSPPGTPGAPLRSPNAARDRNDSVFDGYGSVLVPPLDIATECSPLRL